MRRRDQASYTLVRRRARQQSWRRSASRCRPACRTPRCSPTTGSASAASITGCSRPARESGLIAGAVLAIIVGIVVVAQTLYASTKEHLNEFATLRALGASSGFIRKVILWQAVLSAIMGYVLGMVVAKVVTYLLRDMLPIADDVQSGLGSAGVDGRHVRAGGGQRHLQSDTHRSRCGLQPVGLFAYRIQRWSAPSGRLLASGVIGALLGLLPARDARAKASRVLSVWGT